MRRTVLLFSLFAATLAGCGGGGGEKTPARSEGEAAPRAEGSSIPRNDLSVVLISLDTTRPDRIGCYGNRSIETPRMDALAAEGVRFARAVATNAITLPSHTSLLTGEFPYRHRVRNNGTYRLGDGKTTLAEKLRAEGYRTGAFVSAFVLDSRFGLAQGFDTYDDELPYQKPKATCAIPERRGEETVARAVAWLQERKKEPFFLFVHLFDAHQPYEPPEPYFTRYAKDLYNGEVAYMDEQIGKVLDALDRFGLSRRTIVVLMGDHGQGLGDHGEVTHAMFTYDATIRIPFLLRWPDDPVFREAGLRSKCVIESLVREVDIAPTILDLLGMPPLPDSQGRSLVPLLRDPAASLNLVNYAESFSSREDFGWSEVRSVTTERWKYILLPREELYDLAADPGETKNLAAEKPDVVREMHGLLDQMIAEDLSRKDESQKLDVDEETRAKLDALGYITTGATVGGETSYRDLPDPKDGIGLLAKYFGALSALDRGESGAGLQALLDVEKEDPGSPRVVGSIADAYLMLGDAARAESVYAKTIAMGAKTLPVRSNWGYALYRVGKTDEAIQVLTEVRKADPEMPRVSARLGDIYLTLGRYDEAEKEFQREIETRPDAAVGYLGLGKLCKLQGRTAEAIRYFQKAAENPVEAAQAYDLLGTLYETGGDIEKAVGYYRKAIHADPLIVEAYYNVGVVAKKTGDRETARKYFEDAVRINPLFAKGHYGIGNLHREEGRNREAIEEYRIALSHDRRDPDIYLNLGVAYASLGDLDRAIEAWERAAQVAPDSPSAGTALENARAARAQMGGTR